LLIVDRCTDTYNAIWIAQRISRWSGYIPGQDGLLLSVVEGRKVG